MPHRRKPSRVHHAQHRVPHVGRGGAHQASLGMSGTADGWKRGRGPSAFFQAPHCRQQRPAACHPASPDARSREPFPRTTAAGMAGPVALRDFARSRIRCSWRLGPVRFRHASSPADDGDEHEGVSSKKFSWPLTASAPSAQPDVPRPMSNPKRGNASPASGNAAGRRGSSVGAPSPGSPATRPAKSLIFTPTFRPDPSNPRPRPYTGSSSAAAAASEASWAMR
jgi:hypothetical protein